MNFTAWCLCSLGPGKSAGGGDSGDGDDSKQVSYALFRRTMAVCTAEKAHKHNVLVLSNQISSCMVFAVLQVV